MKLGTKSMWHCSREVKYQQGDTLHTLGIKCSRKFRVCGLMVRVAEFNRGDPSSFHGRSVYTSACSLQYCEVFVKDQ